MRVLKRCYSLSLVTSVAEIPYQLERILELLIELRQSKQDTAKYRALIEKIRVLSAEFEAVEAKKSK